MIDPALSDSERTVRPIPLCVDCDGTFIRTDLLHEAVLRILKRRVWMIGPMIGWLLAGKAAFKAKVAALAPLDPEALPLREATRALIDRTRAEGRPVILATAADHSHAEALAAHHPALFDDVMATGDGTNLSALSKARALVARYGERGYDYIGDAPADVAVWKSARRAYVAAPSRRFLRGLGRYGFVAEAVGEPESALKPMIKALRPHQWMKNALVFLPPAAAHSLVPVVLGKALIAFLAFSLCASSVYVLNDLLDLESDRRHKRKRKRPFASGALSVKAGLLMVPLLVIAAFVLAAAVGWLFAGTLFVYLVITSLYSFRLKQQVIVDVILLAMLYTMRILGGSAATLIPPSFWMLAFSMFLFFSLALVKRYSELIPLLTAGKSDVLAGRGYRASDLPVLMSVGVASGMLAVLVLAFYLDDARTRAIYPSVQLALLAPVLILYWVARLWMKTHRDEMHDDPVVFAARDWQTLVIVALLALLFGLASTHFVSALRLSGH
jgi:4-hydroxybenzoate polyprenyltransferase